MESTLSAPAPVSHQRPLRRTAFDLILAVIIAAVAVAAVAAAGQLSVTRATNHDQIPYNGARTIQARPFVADCWRAYGERHRQAVDRYWAGRGAALSADDTTQRAAHAEALKAFIETNEDHPLLDLARFGDVAMAVDIDTADLERYRLCYAFYDRYVPVFGDGALFLLYQLRGDLNGYFEAAETAGTRLVWTLYLGVFAAVFATTLLCAHPTWRHRLGAKIMAFGLVAVALTAAGLAFAGQYAAERAAYVRTDALAKAVQTQMVAAADLYADCAGIEGEDEPKCLEDARRLAAVDGPLKEFIALKNAYAEGAAASLAVPTLQVLKD